MQSAIQTSALLPGISDTTLIICLLLALAAGALGVIILTLKQSPLEDLLEPFDKNADLKHYRAPADARPAWLGAIAVTLIIVGTTSWLSQRDEKLRAAERAEARAQLAAAQAAREKFKVTINRHKVVEIESGRCYGTANVAKGTTFSSCVD